MSDSLWTPSGEHYVSGIQTPEILESLSTAALRRGRSGSNIQSDENAEVIAEMRKNRQVNRRRGDDHISRTADIVGGYASSGGMSFATGRPQDPMFYWKQSNLPYDIWKEEELVIIRKYARLLYLTHPLIASAVDIFSKYPLQGMTIRCKDSEIEEFYNTLFLEDLNYEDYLGDLLHEYWLAGEAWPFGQWNAALGIWEDDELMNPDDIDVIKTRFQKEPRFEMRLPEDLRKVLREREPRWEYERLVNAYPELMHFMGDDARMPVSNVVLNQIAFKADTFHPRGIPILMRGFRSIFQEEMLNAAQDAVASRLYTPLILAKLGASAKDLGTEVPWVPTPQDLANFEEALDEALSADFRILTHHFALDMESVFGREVMPDLGPDFDRLAERQLQVFGMSKTMLNGASDGETYAADALNLDIMSQLLTRAQKLVKRFFAKRAKVVAEAQGHFDYREENGEKYLIQEEVLKKDPETGEEMIVQQPKLLVPDLEIKSMDMKTEEERQQLFDIATQNGVPISNRTRFVNIPIDLDEEREMVKEERLKDTIADAELRKETFIALSQKGLPIPPNLEQDFRAMAADAQEPRDAAEQLPLPNMVMQPMPNPALAPMPEDYAAEDQEADAGDLPPEEGAANAPDQPQGVVIPMIPQQPNRPPESDERRADMPKASMRKGATIHTSRTKIARKKETPGIDPEVKEGLHRLLSGPDQVIWNIHDDYAEWE